MSEQQPIEPLSETARRDSVKGALAIVRTALVAMKRETRFMALAGLALTALDRIEKEIQ